MADLHTGGVVGVGVGGAPERLAALEAAVTRIDAALAVLTAAVLADGNRTEPALEAGRATGAPDPPPLPSV